jgi:hypothetical protein
VKRIRKHKKRKNSSAGVSKTGTLEESHLLQSSKQTLADEHINPVNLQIFGDGPSNSYNWLKDFFQAGNEKQSRNRRDG